VNGFFARVAWRDAIPEIADLAVGAADLLGAAPRLVTAVPIAAFELADLVGVTTVASTHGFLGAAFSEVASLQGAAAGVTARRGITLDAGPFGALLSWPTTGSVAGLVKGTASSVDTFLPRFTTDPEIAALETGGAWVCHITGIFGIAAFRGIDTDLIGTIETGLAALGRAAGFPWTGFRPVDGWAAADSAEDRQGGDDTYFGNPRWAIHRCSSLL